MQKIKLERRAFHFMFPLHNITQASATYVFNMVFNMVFLCLLYAINVAFQYLESTKMWFHQLLFHEYFNIH